jgi:hypothetical protein
MLEAPENVHDLRWYVFDSSLCPPAKQHRAYPLTVARRKQGILCCTARPGAGLVCFVVLSDDKERVLKVLKLSAQGLPQSWISLEQAVLHYAAGEVRWEVGAQVALFRGGHNAMTGLQSQIGVSSIIGTKGVPNINPFDLKPGLTNGKLFARDRNVCAYCGGDFHEDELTREHIIPFAQNGRDHWMNVVTACRACNHRKSNRTPEQARMPLLYAPYIPSLWEDFILRNRRILADQMEFLMAHLPKNSRLHA